MLYIKKYHKDDLLENESLIDETFLKEVNKINDPFVKLSKKISYLVLLEACKDHGLKQIPEIIKGPYGKPYFKNKEFYFNLSDTHNDQILYVVLATGNKEIGVDIELVKNYKDKLIKHCTNELEYQEIINSDNINFEFTKLWTKKESYLKYTGTGITKDLKNCLNNIDNLFTTKYLEEDKLVITTYEK